MEWLVVWLIAVGLAMDVFAVSLGAGTSGQARTMRAIFRLSFHFGLFQGGMTLLGGLVGTGIARVIAGVDHWIALGLLAFVATRMIRSGLRADDGVQGEDISRGAALVMVSIATSIDALAVGLSLAFFRTQFFSAALIIGIVSSLFSLMGIGVGGRLGERFGRRMEVVGGMVLYGVALRVLITHLA